MQGSVLHTEVNEEIDCTSTSGSMGYAIDISTASNATKKRKDEDNINTVSKKTKLVNKNKSDKQRNLLKNEWETKHA